DQDRTLLTAGPEDGISISTDAGSTWGDCSMDAAVNAVAVSPEFARDRTLYAATDAGVLISSDAGVMWRTSAARGEPALCAVGSTTGSAVAALRAGRLLRLDDN